MYGGGTQNEPPAESNYKKLANIYNIMFWAGGARVLANGVNIGGYENIMKMIFPEDSYGYINILTLKITKENNNHVEDNKKGELLRKDILNWIESSKPKLKEEADAENVTQANFEATYNNVNDFFFYLNEGVYRNIWILAQKAAEEKAQKAAEEEAKATSGGKKKTRRRNKSKRKRKSRRARR